MKRKVLITIIFLLIGSIAACHNDNDSEIFGKYEFDKIIFISPASSYLPRKENLEKTKYIIKKDRFEIISPEGQFKISKPIYKKEEMNEDLIQEFNDKVHDFISFSEYKKKYRYSIYEKENMKNNRYYLYSLDDELWIAEEGRREMWFLYKLK